MATYTQKFNYANKNIVTKVIMCSPIMAERMLQKNPSNRMLNDKNVLNLVTAILNGDWEVNGETVTIDKKGSLADGQHRLRAIIKSGMTVPLMVVTGVSEKARDTSGQAQPRLTGQVLDMDNFTKAGTGTPICAITKAIVAYDTLGFITDHLGSKFVPRTAKASIEEYGLENLEVSFEVSKQFRGRASLLTPALAGTLHFIFSRIDERQSSLFFHALLTGDCQGQQGLLKFREFLIGKQLVKTSTGKRLSRRHVAGITIKTWNAWRDGRDMKDYEYKTGEEFPKAR